MDSDLHIEVFERNSTEFNLKYCVQKSHNFNSIFPLYVEDKQSFTSHRAMIDRFTNTVADLGGAQPARAPPPFEICFYKFPPPLLKPKKKKKRCLIPPGYTPVATYPPPPT